MDEFDGVDELDDEAWGKLFSPNAKSSLEESAFFGELAQFLPLHNEYETDHHVQNVNPATAQPAVSIVNTINLSLLKKLQNPNIKALLNVLKSPTDEGKISGQSKIDKLVSALITMDGGNVNRVFEGSSAENLRSRRQGNNNLDNLIVENSIDNTLTNHHCVENVENDITMTPMSRNILKTLSNNDFEDNSPNNYYHPPVPIEDEPVIALNSVLKSVPFDDFPNASEFDIFDSAMLSNAGNGNNAGYNSVVPPTPKDYLHAPTVPVGRRTGEINTFPITLPISTSKPEKRKYSKVSTSKSRMRRDGNVQSILPVDPFPMDNQTNHSYQDEAGDSVCLQENSYSHFFGYPVVNSNALDVVTHTLPPLSAYNIPSLFPSSNTSSISAPSTSEIGKSEDDNPLVCFPFSAYGEGEGRDISAPLTVLKTSVTKNGKGNGFGNSCDTVLNYFKGDTSLEAYLKLYPINSVKSSTGNGVKIDKVAKDLNIPIRIVQDIARILVFLKYVSCIW